MRGQENLQPVKMKLSTSPPIRLKLRNQNCSLVGVVGAARLNDLRARRAGLVVVVAVVMAAVVVVLAHVHDDARGGGRGRVQLILLARPEFGDGAQQVVVDDGRGIVRLFPPHRGRGRGGDQELLLWFGRLQAGAANVHRLCEVEPHLSAVEAALVQPEPRFRSRQSVAEADPHSAKRLEILELHLGVERTEQGLETRPKTPLLIQLLWDFASDEGVG